MKSRSKPLLVLSLVLVVLMLTSCQWIFNRLPTANIYASAVGGEAPITVEFDGSGSYDPDGTITNYRWQFRDGGIAYGALVSHTYQDDGIYTASLTVTDNNGATDSNSISITVLNPAPIADFTFYPLNPPVGEEVTFDASISYDPASFVTPETVSWYEWDFGDGVTAYGMTTTHTYQESNTFQVALTISDDDGAMDTSTKEITVGSYVEYYFPTFYWKWNNINWSWEVPIPKYLYQYFNSKPRPQCFPLPSSCDYGEFVLNPDDDSLMNSLADELASGIGDYFDKLENALYFTQAGIRYDSWESPPEWFECPNCPAPITKIMGCDEMCYTDPDTGQEQCGCEWPRYPVETLASGYGDCEDTSILFASVVRTLGYGARLAEIPGHMGGLAPVDSGWVQANRGWLESRCLQVGLFFNAFSDPGNPNKTWLWAETAVDSGYIPLGCYTEYLSAIDSWDVSSKSWIKLTSLAN